MIDDDVTDRPLPAEAHSEQGELPRVLSDGKTPSEWVRLLAEAGITVSERTLRERARAKGACRILGNAMIIFPEHIDQIFEEPPARTAGPRRHRR